MKKLFLLISLLLIGCSKEELFFPNPADIDIVEVESPQPPPPFEIYGTSFEIHEYNNGYYSLHTTKLPDDPWLIVGMTYVDFNKDGYVDIVGKDEYNPSVLKLYTNQGDDTYTVSVLPSENGFPFDEVGPRKVISADVNNDGELDIIVGLAPDDFENPRGLYIFENKGNGESFYGHTIISGEHDWIHAVSAGDINNDGFIDIFMGGLDYLFLGNGDFTFTKKDLPNYINNAVSCELVDINQDGLLDVLLGSHKPSYDPSAVWGKFGNSHSIHYGTGDDNLFSEEYVLESNYDGTNITLDFTVIDFDNDGDLDLFANSNFDYGSKYVIQYYENNGYMNFINKSSDVFENECNLVPNHNDIDWIKFIDMDDDGIKELMVEAANWDKTGGEYLEPAFNGFQLNENKKFIRKMFK